MRGEEKEHQQSCDLYEQGREGEKRNEEAIEGLRHGTPGGRQDGKSRVPEVLQTRSRGVPHKIMWGGES